MTEAKHTPGPWYYRKGDEWSHSVVTSHGELPDGSTNYWTVASINKQREPEHEANAHLISATPELLEALNQILVSINRGQHISTPIGTAQRWFDVLDEVRAAIAKATGQKQ